MAKNMKLKHSTNYKEVLNIYKYINGGENIMYTYKKEEE